MDNLHRRRPVALAVVTAVVLLAGAACSQDGGDPAPAASGATSPAASGATSAAAKSGGCADGAFKDPAGLYCLVVPPGYKSDGPTKTTDGDSQDTWSDDSGFSFQVDSWAAGGGKRTLEDVKRSFSATRGNMHLLESSDLDNGGVYERLHNPDSDNYTVRSVTQIGDKVVECQGRSHTQLKPTDACKTLHAQ